MRKAACAVIALEEAPARLDLSRWTGRRDLPPGTPGDARVAQVTDLRRIRDKKLYARVTRTWEEFCEKHLLISRRSVDRNIRRLREFGPAFFRAAAAMPLSSREFRQIREHVGVEGVQFDGVLIPFGASNRRQLADALDELLHGYGPKPP